MPMPVFRTVPFQPTLVILSLAVIGTNGYAAQGSSEELAFFEAKVRPVLAQNCFECHGAKKQQASLRLDSRDGVLKGSDHGAVIEEGNPDASKLIKAIRHEGEIKMPDKAAKLADAQIADVARWITLGLPWPDEPQPPALASIDEKSKSHWAFQPLVAPPVPLTTNANWPRGDLDRFILAKLEAKGMTPAPEVDPRTLIRRAYADLIGFPPSYEEVDAFVKESTMDADAAYARLVDQLLASPHYGERWGRFWLDIARYADSKGYVFQEERRYPFAYTYRDWVIDAHNNDLPYDQFLTYQLAADKAIAPDDLTNRKHLAAMGFLTVGRRFLNRQPDIIDDRIDVVSRGMQGLTVACARCHDHKFDPIPTADYYSLYGVFASSNEPGDEAKPVLGDPKDAAAYEKFQQELSALETEVANYLQAKRDAARSSSQIALYLESAADGWDNAEQARIVSDTRNIYPKLTDKWIAFLRQTADAGDPALALWHALRGLSAEDFTAQAVAKITTLKATNAANPHVLASFEANPPSSPLDFHQKFASLLAEAFAKAENGTPDEQSLRAPLIGAESPVNFEPAQIEGYFNRKHRDELRNVRNRIDALRSNSPGAPPRAMVMKDNDQPYDPVIFKRGNPDNRGDAVPRQFLKILSGDSRQPFSDGSGRLELAKAITAPTNPLTPRVMANRVWLAHFGASLVETPSDFGLQCPEPLQRDLLDWLASHFREDGWSLKKLHRTIMLSSTYRQSSDHRPEYSALDPDNRLFHRMNRRRLEFEALRDSLLKVTGSIDLAVGGRAVDITAQPFSTRRSVYGFIDRQNLPALFRTFDFASPDTHSPKRHSTTVPQQALFMMNSEFAIEQARAMTNDDSFRAQSDDPSRVSWLYRRIFARSPDDEERAIGIEFVAGGDPQTPTAWLYGFGTYDETEKVTRFTRFPHWTSQSWQGGEIIPDSEIGWASVQANGGHPGNDQNHATILRWIATRDATVEVAGELKRPSMEGDGIRGRVVSNRFGLLASWDILPGQSIATQIPRFEVREGDVIDFLVDCRDNPSFDGYTWDPRIQPIDEGKPLTDAQSEFAGPIDINAWQRYAQALLSSNEFLFVD
jgi:mono/diheme cytochrome c family protein